MSNVSVESKKRFLTYFLGKYTMQERTCQWILDALVMNEKLLELCHFVDSTKGYEDAMTMGTTEDFEAEGFFGIISGTKTVNPEKVLHFLGHNEDTPFYVDLQFSDRMKDPKFLEVLEENTKSRVRMTSKERTGIEELLTKSIENNRKNIMMQLINQSLDTGNKERFIELSNIYKEMTR